MLTADQVFDAFCDVPYPGDDNITGPCRCGECEEIADYFRGTGQRGHTVENLRRYQPALSLFTPAAFHYWLPSFVVAMLEDPETADVIDDSLCFDFSGRGQPDDELMGRLSERQLDVLIAYQQEYRADLYEDPKDKEEQRAIVDQLERRKARLKAEDS